MEIKSILSIKDVETSELDRVLNVIKIARLDYEEQEMEISIKLNDPREIADYELVNEFREKMKDDWLIVSDSCSDILSSGKTVGILFDMRFRRITTPGYWNWVAKNSEILCDDQISEEWSEEYAAKRNKELDEILKGENWDVRPFNRQKETQEQIAREAQEYKEAAEYLEKTLVEKYGANVH